jgi:hydrogenase nickel incorporation protein HypA/HybF
MMHEFTLMADLMKKIEQIAVDNDAEQVLRVKVQLGALSHISEDHFREHFEHAIKGTVAENARLDVVCHEDETDPNAQDILLVSVDLPE